MLEHQYKMHKIMITGNAGSGKTTVSYRLAKIFNRTDVISLDKIVWRPGWKLVSKEERELEIAKITKMQTWIAEGVSKTLIKEADIIIFLDYPRRICYWRAFKRNYKYLFKSRPGLPEQCPEILIMGELIKIIWNFPNIVKLNLLRYLNEDFHKKVIFHITNNRELEKVVSKLNSDLKK